MNVKNKTRDDIFSLSGRVGLVTGASGHLGKSMAWVLAKAGAHVVINARTESKLNFLASEMSEQNLKVTAIAGDICDDQFQVFLATQLKEKFGRLDILISNAYEGSTGNLESATREDFSHSFDTIVNASFLLYKRNRSIIEAAAKSTFGGASIIHISSMYGTVSPDPSIYGDSKMNNPPFYGTGKAALIQLTKYMACHLGKDKIRVNAISPGPFPPEEIMKSNPDFYQNLCRKNPLGRIGTAQELDGAILFLSSDASSFVTGINIPVDGGWTAW